MGGGRPTEKVEVVEEDEEEQEDEEKGEEDIDVEKALARGDKLFIKEDYGNILIFGISWWGGEGREVDLDLACVAVRSDGSVEDCAFYGSLKGTASWVRHMGDNVRGGISKDTDHERICVHVDAIPDSVHALLFIISSFQGDAEKAYESSCGEVEEGGGGEGRAVPEWALFRVHSQEMEEVVKTSVQEEIGQPSTGSLLVCSLDRIPPIRGRPPAWGITGVRTPARARSWPAAIHELHSQLLTLVPSLAPQPSIQGPFAAHPKLTQLNLDELVACAHSTVLGHWSAASHSSAESTDTGTGETAPSEKVAPNLRADVGWLTEEGVKNDAEIYCLLFDNNGELLDQVSRKAREVDGVWLATDPKARDAEESEWPGLFPVKEQLGINLNELAEGTTSIVILLANFSGPGLSIVQSCHCRLIDTTSEDDPKDLVVLNLDIPQQQEDEEEEDVNTAIVLCRLCRRVRNQADIAWRRCASPDPAKFLMSVREQKQDLSKMSMESVPEEPWRIQTEGLLSRGNSIADCMDCLTDCVTYHGGRDAKQRRDDEAAVATYASGDAFWGKYVAGMRQGMGVYFFNNGGMFLGSYKNGLRSGEGWFVLPDGSWYEGGFRKDRMHGHGSYVYAHGDKYVGDYKKGKKSGHGTYYYNDGGQITGEWKDGAHDGSAVWLQGSYAQFEGGFRSGIPEGQGTYVFPKTGLLQPGSYRTAKDLEEPPRRPLWQGLEWLPDKCGLYQKLDIHPVAIAHRPSAMANGSHHLKKAKQRHGYVRARGKNFHL